MCLAIRQAGQQLPQCARYFIQASAAVIHIAGSRIDELRPRVTDYGVKLPDNSGWFGRWLLRARGLNLPSIARHLSSPVRPARGLGWPTARSHCIGPLDIPLRVFPHAAPARLRGS
jgi:hypothetical protein